MGVSIINKDVSVISSILSRPKASISTVFGVGGWAGGGPGTQGPNNPGSARDAGFGDVSWSNVNNILTSNNSYASCTLSPSNMSNYLEASNFGFSIPTSATINGIEVAVEGYANYVNLSGVILWSDGTYPVGTQIGSKTSGIFFDGGTYDQTYTLGGPADLWGSNTATPTLINRSDFAVLIAFLYFDIKGSDEMFVDNIKVKIDYTT